MKNIGWGVNQYKSELATGHAIAKHHVRGIDKTELNNFCHHSGVFANTMDKNMGMGYTDKISIRDMRQYVYDVMDKVNQCGSFTSYNNSGSKDSYVESRFKVEVQQNKCPKFMKMKED